MTWKQFASRFKDPRNVFAGLLVIFGAAQAYSESIVKVLGPFWSGVVLVAIGFGVKVLPWLERLASESE
jgi:hypothetical protein